MIADIEYYYENRRKVYEIQMEIINNKKVYNKYIFCPKCNEYMRQSINPNIDCPRYYCGSCDQVFYIFGDELCLSYDSLNLKFPYVLFGGWLPCMLYPDNISSDNIPKWSISDLMNEPDRFPFDITKFQEYRNEVIKMNSSNKENNGEKHHYYKNRYELLKKANFKCQCCGSSPKEDPSVRLQIDHIKPKSKGGTDKKDNLQILCWECNIGKGNRDSIKH